MTSTATPLRQRRKLERPQELLDAALSLFVEKGFAATRSEEVAQRAGVSKGTLYLYYPSKEELLKAVVRRGMESGEFRTLPVEATAQALIAPVVFLALHQHSVGACAVKGCAWIEPQAMLNLHLDLVLNGLRTTPAADAAAKPGASGADASVPASRKAAR